VVEGETGAFYERSDPAALAETVAAFDPLEFDPAHCVEQARRFGIARFREGLQRVVSDALAEPRVERPPRRMRRLPARLRA
jgi:hypothetical protein